MHYRGGHIISIAALTGSAAFGVGTFIVVTIVVALCALGAYCERQRKNKERDQ